jgi:hypothetical protein
MSISVVILDEDRWHAEILKSLLATEFPGVRVMREEPQVALERVRYVAPAVLIINVRTLRREDAEQREQLDEIAAQPGRVAIIPMGLSAEDRQLVPRSLRDARFLVKLSEHEEDDFNQNILGVVQSALWRLRLWLPFRSPEGAQRERLAEQRAAWLEGAGRPSGSRLPCSRELEGVLPAGFHDAVIRHRHLRRCLAIEAGDGSWTEAPWEWLAPPGIDAFEAPFLAARVFPGPRRLRRPAGRKLRAVWGLFSPHQREQLTGAVGRAALARLLERMGASPLRPITDQDGIGAKRIGAACRTEPGEETIDLLHVVCHAERTADGGQLLLCDRFQDAAPAAGRELAEALAPHPPRVVVLESCPSGLGPGGVAAELIRVGVDAVIGFQVKPTQLLGGQLMTALYQGLAEDGRLDTAVWTARQALRDQPGPGWAALTVSVRDETGLDALSGWRAGER